MDLGISGSRAIVCGASAGLGRGGPGAAEEASGRHGRARRDRLKPAADEIRPRPARRHGDRRRRGHRRGPRRRARRLPGA